MHGRRVSITGLGYVGLPVAIAFGKHGSVVGFDIDQDRINALRAGRDDTNEVDASELVRAEVSFTSDPKDLRAADFHIVAVPTPIDAAKQPDLEPLSDASRTIGGILERGDVVVYESTVYPGATEEFCIPILETASGLRAGRDFGVGYSPERLNPGDRAHRFESITKVVSGLDADVLSLVSRVYGSVVEAGVHEAPSIRVAEAAKVIENTQRDLNIALMNELAELFARMGIDTQDVLAAARTKWNFLPFEPGLVGGHCIGVDPYYLTYKAAAVGHHPQIILAGRRINDDLGSFIAGEVVKAVLRDEYLCGHRTVTVLGLTFKENVGDLRNTKVVTLVRGLREFGFDVQVHDPTANSRQAMRALGIELLSLDQLRPASAVVVAVAHRQFRAGGWSLIRSLLRDGRGVAYDVRATLERTACPDAIRLLRL